jgi:hypothetical protein
MQEREDDLGFGLRADDVEDDELAHGLTLNGGYAP